MPCFWIFIQFVGHLLQFYHQAGFSNPWLIAKDAIMSVYNFWTANPNHGQVCTSQ